MRKVIIASLVLLAAGPTWAAAPDCKLGRIEEWQVRMERNLPVIEGEINNQKVGILLDTGAERSVITRSAAARLMLERYDATASRMYVIADRPIEAVKIDDLRIGSARRSNWAVLLAPQHDFGADIGVILGKDFFSNVDLELDFPNRAVRLFQAKNCAGASLAYWAKGAASEVALESGSPTFIVAVNGRPLRARFDTGTPVSAMTAVDAARFGVTTKSAGAERAGCTLGVGRKPVDYWSAPFESVAIGNEVIRNPRLRFGDLFKEAAPFDDLPQMVLGVDFLLAHRVYIAQSQRKLYFTYTGGKVFPAEAAKDCHDLR